MRQDPSQHHAFGLGNLSSKGSFAHFDVAADKIYCQDKSTEMKSTEINISVLVRESLPTV
jgi:hypothetical protein